jgi:myo-inositol-1(or 4)-monophosphatase
VGNDSDDLSLLEEIAGQAGKIAMKYFKSENEVWMKPGDSPVSRADMEVNNYLQEQLLGARSDYGWLSEETEDSANRLDQTRVFIVDPIDGTRGFINGADEWCISVAIVENGKPVAAVLECPALNERYCAKKGDKTRLNGEIVQASISNEIKYATGSRKINEMITSSTAGRVEVTPFIPSLAYRIALVAGGKIDLALARPGAHDWDLAAADLILSSAGGVLVGLNGENLRYNRKKLRHESLIACPASLQISALELAKTAGFLH